MLVVTTIRLSKGFQAWKDMVHSVGDKMKEHGMTFVYASQIHSVHYLPVKRADTSRPIQCASCSWTFTKQLVSRTRPVIQVAGHILPVWPTRV